MVLCESGENQSTYILFRPITAVGRRGVGGRVGKETHVIGKQQSDSDQGRTVSS